MSAPIHAQMMVGLYMQGWQSLGILAAANLGIADALEAGPRTVEALAGGLGVDARSLFRLLRALASKGIFRQVEPRVFTNSPLSESLRSGAPGGARELIRAFGLESTRRSTVAYERAIATGRGALELELGWSNPFERLAAAPEEAELYDEGMAAAAAAQADAILASFDFSRFRRLVDVGGGRGALLASILARNPEQRGVLFDMPRAVARAAGVMAQHGVAERCELQSGSFFDAVPSDGDGYILKNILHGCSDARAREILANIHERAAPAARVMIIELVMPPHDAPGSTQALFDLFLLLGGADTRVRSQSEFIAILQPCGFELLRIVPTASHACVIEAERRA